VSENLGVPEKCGVLRGRDKHLGINFWGSANLKFADTVLAAISDNFRL